MMFIEATLFIGAGFVAALGLAIDVIGDHLHSDDPTGDSNA